MLSICSILYNEEETIPMLIEGHKDIADEFVIGLSPNNTDKTEQLLKEYIEQGINIKLIYTGFVEPDKYDFGKARTKVFEAASGDWIFWLDADECLDNRSKAALPELIKSFDTSNIDCCNVQYIHYIENFSKIDNSLPMHIGAYRLHKKIPSIRIDRKNHALPIGWKSLMTCPSIIIHHLGYLRGMFKIRERFKRNYDFSEMHTPWQQCQWRDWHYNGEYPTKPSIAEFIPKIIKDKFYMDVKQ